jgi:hypothetical protein
VFALWVGQKACHVIGLLLRINTLPHQQHQVTSWSALQKDVFPCDAATP